MLSTVSERDGSAQPALAVGSRAAVGAGRGADTNRCSSTDTLSAEEDDSHWLTTLPGCSVDDAVLGAIASLASASLPPLVPVPDAGVSSMASDAVEPDSLPHLESW